MNDIKPTYFLEVWHSPVLGLCWAERGFLTVSSFNMWFDYHEHFFGATATVHCGTNDYEITREELMSVATKHVKNDCVTLQFDLKNITVTKIDGRPENPRQ